MITIRGITQFPPVLLGVLQKKNLKKAGGGSGLGPIYQPGKICAP